MNIDGRGAENPTVAQASDAEMASTTSNFVPAARGALCRFANAIAITAAPQRLNVTGSQYAKITNLPEHPIAPREGRRGEGRHAGRRCYLRHRLSERQHAYKEKGQLADGHTSDDQDEHQEPGDIQWHQGRLSGLSLSEMPIDDIQDPLSARDVARLQRNRPVPRCRIHR